ncbi:MAG: ATP-binding cassette domain-containing protein [Erysipelotrichaceae bacterium]|nr:ATP-binding cassette domain-containing protein [Erysipelotrichaceae bacterium]
MIKVQELTKIFRKPIRGKGLIGMISTLFSRKYTEIRAVDGVSFDIPEGEIVGYIGSNGAGKSTTIKMMCGILTPTSGKVFIGDKEPYLKRRVVAKDIGVVFGQKSQLWWDIPLVESFKVLKEIYQVSDEDYEERMSFLSSVLGIDEFMTQPVRTLSLGQRMRADLAASMLHNPKILFLDEPTIGMDVLVKEKIRTAIHALNAKYHTTIVLTTHDMADIENLCSRIIMIEKGKIIYDGPLRDIKRRFGNIKTLTLTVPPSVDPEKVKPFSDDVAMVLDKDNKDKVVLKFDADKVVLEHVVQYAFSQYQAIDMKIADISIEDVVKQILSQQEEEHEKAKKI